MGPLFDERPEFDRETLTCRLAALAADGVYFGTSSWKYAGWLGQVYTRERYLNRGRFSQRLFEAECLSEYARTFPAVCGDFSFYQFPAEDYWGRLFAKAPAPFLFAFKVPEQITCKTFPAHPRYGGMGGRANENYLDVALLDAMFLRPLAPYRKRIAALIFEFGTFSRKNIEDNAEFFGRLDGFLARLPEGFRYGVEVRNPELLERPYFDVLRTRGAAHVYNAWTRMPELKAQLAIPEASTAGFTVARALLRRGRAYEEAVRAFSPYERVQDPNPDAREALRELVRRARANRQLAFLFVNNRLEGNAPETVMGVTEE